MRWSVGGVILLDGIFYTVLTPMLPGLTAAFRLSEAAAGVLSACYAIGAFLGTPPSLAFVSSWGPRAGVAAGTLLFVLSSVLFGVARDPVPLFVGRLGQGLGAAFTWTAGLSWMLAVAAPERRGRAIGAVESVSLVGSLMGPAVGATAASIGRAPVFLAAALAAGVLLAGVARAPAILLPGGCRVQDLRSSVSSPELGAAMWLLALAGLLVGTISVLMPLRLAALGVGASGIGATFLGAAVALAVVNPVLGVSQDRGWVHAAVFGALALSAGSIASLALPVGAVTAAVLTAISTFAVGMIWTPAIAMLTRACEAARMSLAVSAALLSLCWAPALTVGAVAASAIAGSIGNAPVMLGGALLCVAAVLRLAAAPAVIVDPAQRARIPSRSRSQ